MASREQPETFRELRERKGFGTIAGLAAKARQQATTVTKIECGKVSDPRYTTVTSLAKALRVAPETVKRAIDRTRRAA